MVCASRSDLHHRTTGQNMTERTISRPPSGLHGKAVQATLDLVTEMHSRRPSLGDVASRLDLPESRLRDVFPDEESLLIAAAEQALMILVDSCTRSVVKVDPDDPVAQFTALGDAYLEWAERYRAQFRLLSDSRLLDSLGIPALRRYLDSVSDLMRRMLQRAKDRGQLHADENIDLMVLTSRCYVFGVACMIADDRLAVWAPGVSQVEAGKRMTHDFIRRMALSSQPLPAANNL